MPRKTRQDVPGWTSDKFEELRAIRLGLGLCSPDEKEKTDD